MDSVRGLFSLNKSLIQESHQLYLLSGLCFSFDFTLRNQILKHDLCLEPISIFLYVVMQRSISRSEEMLSLIFPFSRCISQYFAALSPVENTYASACTVYVQFHRMGQNYVLIGSALGKTDLKSNTLTFKQSLSQFLMKAIVLC